MSAIYSIMPPLPVEEDVEFQHCTGWPGYCVGDNGSVWSCRPGRHRHGYLNWGMLRPLRQTAGYCAVKLYYDGVPHPTFIHRLVLETFVDVCPPGKESRHLNGDPTDNRLANLCWGTHQENYNDSVLHGTSSRGERQGNAKLSSNQIREIRHLAHDHSQYELATRFGVHQTAISLIVTRKNWKHIA